MKMSFIVFKMVVLDADMDMRQRKELPRLTEGREYPNVFTLMFCRVLSALIPPTN
jgi:hypothetical protein